MAGGKNKIHEHEKANSNGFDKNPQNINRAGLNVSIRERLKELMRTEGQYIIPANQVINIDKEGNVIVEVPTQTKIALRLNKWVDSNKANDSLKAINMIMDQIDGRPKQPLEISINAEDFELSLISPELYDIMKYLLMVGSNMEEMNDSKALKILNNTITRLNAKENVQ